MRQILNKSIDMRMRLIFRNHILIHEANSSPTAMHRSDFSFLLRALLAVAVLAISLLLLHVT